MIAGWLNNSRRKSGRVVLVGAILGGAPPTTADLRKLRLLASALDSRKLHLESSSVLPSWVFRLLGPT